MFNYLLLTKSVKQDNADKTLSYEVNLKKHTNILKYTDEKVKKSVKVLINCSFSFLKKTVSYINRGILFCRE